MNRLILLSTLLLLCFSLSLSAQSDLEILQKKVRETPNNVENRLALCEAYHKAGTLDSLGVHGQHALEDALLNGNAKAEAKAHLYLGVYFSKREFAESEAHFHSSIRLAKGLQEPFIASEAHRLLSSILQHKGSYSEAENELDSARISILKAISQNDSRENQIQKAKIELNTGFLFSSSEQPDLALEKALFVREKAIQFGDSSLLASAFTLMGAINNKLLQYQQSLDNNKKALAIFIALDDDKGAARALSNIGLSFNGLGQHDSAMIYLKLPLEMARKAGNPRSLVLRLNNLGSSFYGMKKYEDAEAAYLETVAIAKANGLIPRLCAAYRNLAYLYLRTGRYAEAELHADSAIVIGDSIRQFRQVAASYNTKYQVAKAKKDFEQALHFHEIQNQYIDSIYSEAHLAELTALEGRFRNKEKLQEISTLKQEAEISDLRLQRRDIILYGLIGFVIVLGVLAYILVKQSLLRQNQRLMAVEQRLFRSQINPHFFFNALSNIQSYLLRDKDPKKTAVLLSRFAKLMREVLDSSTEEEVSIAEEVESLQNYLELQRMRFKQQFEYDIQVGEDLDPEDVMMPSMLAQPFVENALEHGIQHLEGEGRIHIHFIRKNGFLELEIADNGIGIEKSQELKAEKHSHVSRALQITRDRLYLLKKKTRKNIEFTIQNAVDGSGNISGTRVQMQLPLLV